MSENDTVPKDISPSDSTEDYGYYFYPHRNQQGLLKHKHTSMTDKFSDWAKKRTHNKCIMNAHTCAVKSM